MLKSRGLHRLLTVKEITKYMSILSPPTLEQLRDTWMEDGAEDLELIHEENGPDDHGYSWTYVFKRLADETYWTVSGVCQGGGDYHQLRELGCSEPVQVWPHTVSRTEYKSVPPKGDQ